MLVFVCFIFFISSELSIAQNSGPNNNCSTDCPLSSSETVMLPDDFPGYSVNSFVVPERYKPDLDRILIPQGLISDRTQRMAEQIIAEMGNEPFIAICVLKGAYRFFFMLLEEMKTYGNNMITVEFVRFKSYIDGRSSGTVKSGQVFDLATLQGKNVLIVEDLVGTGRTMAKILDLLDRPENKPKTIKVASLLIKRVDKSSGYVPDYAGFSIPEGFVVGCGMDFNEKFRNLNHISLLNQEGVARYSVKESVHEG